MNENIKKGIAAVAAILVGTLTASQAKAGVEDLVKHAQTGMDKISIPKHYGYQKKNGKIVWYNSETNKRCWGMKNPTYRKEINK